MEAFMALFLGAVLTCVVAVHSARNRDLIRRLDAKLAEHLAADDRYVIEPDNDGDHEDR